MPSVGKLFTLKQMHQIKKKIKILPSTFSLHINICMSVCIKIPKENYCYYSYLCVNLYFLIKSLFSFSIYLNIEKSIFVCV